MTTHDTTTGDPTMTTRRHALALAAAAAPARCHPAAVLRSTPPVDFAGEASGRRPQASPLTAGRFPSAL